jgi:hypothetical protein
VFCVVAAAFFIPNYRQSFSQRLREIEQGWFHDLLPRLPS